MDKEKLNKMVELIYDQLKLKNEMSKNFLIEAINAIMTFDDKHTEKGLNGIEEWGNIPILMEISKRFRTLKSIYKGEEPREESPNSEDKLWQDVAVYSLIGLLVSKGKWE